MVQNYRKKRAFTDIGRKNAEKILAFQNKVLRLHPFSGCSSARLEYASGGRGVAGSNPVTPTTKETARLSGLAVIVLDKVIS